MNKVSFDNLYDMMFVSENQEKDLEKGKKLIISGGRLDFIENNG